MISRGVGKDELILVMTVVAAGHITLMNSLMSISPSLLMSPTANRAYVA